MESGSFSGNTQSNESEQPNIPEPNQNIYAHLMSIDRAQSNFKLQIAHKDSEIATLKMELAETKLAKVIPYQKEIFNELGHIKDLISNNLQGQTNEPVMNLDKFKELFNIETKQIEEKCNTRIQEIVFSQNASLEELRQEFIEKEKNLSLKFCNLLDERMQEKDACILELENRMLRKLETGLVEIQKQNLSNNVPESPISIKPATSRKDSVPDRISNFENSMNNNSYLINSSIDADSVMLPEGDLVIDESQGSNNSSQETQLQAVSEPGPQVQKFLPSSSFSISPASSTLSTTRSMLSNSQANSLMPPPVTPHVQLTSVHDKTKVHENIYTPKKNNDQLQKQSQPSSTSSKTSFNFAKDLNVPYDPKVSKQNKYWNDSPRPNSQSSTFQFGKDLQKRTRDNIILSGSESSLSSDTSHFKRQNSLSFPANQPQIQKSSNINFKTSQLNLLNASSTELPSNFNQYNSFMGSQNRKSQNRKSKDSGNFISMDDLEDC